MFVAMSKFFVKFFTATNSKTVRLSTGKIKPNFERIELPYI